MGEPLTARGRCVFFGPEEEGDGHARRFVAKIEFDEPPNLPMWVAWGAEVEMRTVESRPPEGDDKESGSNG